MDFTATSHRPPKCGTRGDEKWHLIDEVEQWDKAVSVDFDVIKDCSSLISFLAP